MNTYCPSYLRVSGTLLLFGLLLLTGFTACSTGNDGYVITPAGNVVEVDESSAVVIPTLPICHYDAETNVYERHQIHEKDWQHHAQHGDVRLDDQDKDGFIAFNHCDAAEGRQIFDCDDQDIASYPTNAERCDEIDRDCSGDPMNRYTRVFDADGRALDNGYVAFGAPVGAVVAPWVMQSSADACNKIGPPRNVTGKIVLIDPKAGGTVPSCPEAAASFSRQAFRAQVSGAVGVIVCIDTDAAAPMTRHADTPKPVTIPVSAISPKECARLQAQAPAPLSLYTRSVCGVPSGNF